MPPTSSFKLSAPALQVFDATRATAPRQSAIRAALLLALLDPPGTPRHLLRRPRLQDPTTVPLTLDPTNQEALRRLVPRYFSTASHAIEWAITTHPREIHAYLFHTTKAEQDDIARQALATTPTPAPA